MFVPAVVEYFKEKLVASIIVLTCSLNYSDRVNLTRQLSLHSMRATFSCSPNILDQVPKYGFQGILYVTHSKDNIIEKVRPEHFSMWYKWLIIDDGPPEFLDKARYDSDLMLLKPQEDKENYVTDTLSTVNTSLTTVYFDDIYVHPSEGVSIHPWASFTKAGLRVTHEYKRIQRRLNLKKYPLKVAAPVGLYSPDWFDGTFQDYVRDEAMPERDSGVRCGYRAASLICETLNATEVLVETMLWVSMSHNNSMFRMIADGGAHLSGAIIRFLPGRFDFFDFFMPLWPFSVGFTFLADRESSSNMFVEPFSADVWWSCLGIGIVLALAQRITARRQEEKEGAYIAVLATWLQQDASAVPEGISGRWSFVCLSMAAMLVHAYYTSAIVSALMSTGTGGPSTMRALGDSKYAIASEDYDYMKDLFFEVKTDWTDLEYMKKKKKTSKFYQDIERGVDLIREGTTAYHTEYNRIYPYLRTFSDNHVCRLQHVDTIVETLSWIATNKRGEWTNIFRIKGAWLHETGLAKLLVSRFKVRPPPCRTALLAERVKLGDIVPALGVTALGAFVACVVLCMEFVVAKLNRRKKNQSAGSEVSLVGNA